jgi:hypothetical protein
MDSDWFKKDGRATYQLNARIYLNLLKKGKSNCPFPLSKIVINY